MHTGYYVAIRFVLWIVAVAVAVLPVTMHDKVDLAWGLPTTIENINSAGVFRELFFVIIPVSVLAISTLVDYLCKKYFRLSGTAVALSVLALIFNTTSLSSGLIGFSRINHNLTISSGQLSVYSTLIMLALAVSLATEIGVSCEHRR